MKTGHDVIRKPIVSEKAIIAKEKNKILFKVDKQSSKFEIKDAVESVFKVKVEKVNILNTNGKERGWGRNSGYRPGYKKAIVTLKDGSSIEVFDQV